MKLKYLALSSVAALLLASPSTWAVPITGSIGFTGGLTYNTSSSATATAVTSWINPQVTLDSGAFAAPSLFAIAAGTAVTFAPGVWNFNTTSPINNFWTVGGFTFELLSSSILQQGGVPSTTGYVVVSGTGIVSGNGYSDTSMSWTFTAQDPAASLSPESWTFSTSATAVPDRAGTAGLLGIACAGLMWVSRKIVTA